MEEVVKNEDFQSSPEMYEALVKASVGNLCVVAWWNSSPYVREKYTRFEVSQEEYNEYGIDEMVPGEACGFEGTLRFVQQFFDPTLEFSLDDLEDQRKTGRLLRMISFFGCEIGDLASVGDIEIFLRFLAREKVASGISPIELYRLYLAGEIVPLRNLLYEQLILANARMKRFVRTKNQPYSGHAPSPWIYSGGERWRLSYARIDTNFFLLTSLFGVSGVRRRHSMSAAFLYKTRRSLYCVYIMSLILGIDEAGRGPIAGPVSVGIVAVEEEFDLLAAFPGLNDSKQLSEKKREKLFELLAEHVRAGNVQYHVEFSSAAMIDEEGIVPAIRAALDASVRKLLPNSAEGKIFLDGSLSAPKEYQQETIIGGDGIVPAIMLASVAAKVVRDRLMISLAEQYPIYGFEKHKGYGTKAHYTAITENGLCTEHRRSFLKSFI